MMAITEMANYERLVGISVRPRWRWRRRAAFVLQTSTADR